MNLAENNVHAGGEVNLRCNKSIDASLLLLLLLLVFA
jgi:hypothetical protein